jgi:hypothetical protein
VFEFCFELASGRTGCVAIPVLPLRLPAPIPAPDPEPWIIFHDDPRPHPWTVPDLQALAAAHHALSAVHDRALRRRLQAVVGEAAQQAAAQLPAGMTLNLRGEPAAG